MRRPMKPIPIARGRDIAEQYGYDQVVIIARRVGDGGGEHVTTYGRDKDNCVSREYKNDAERTVAIHRRSGKKPSRAWPRLTFGSPHKKD